MTAYFVHPGFARGSRGADPVEFIRTPELRALAERIRVALDMRALSVAVEQHRQAQRGRP